MAAQNELESVGAFVKAVVSDAALKYEVPSQATKDTLVVRIQTNDYESETRYHYRIDRTYQIITYGADSPLVTTKMDAIARKVNDKTTMIPIAGTLRYIRTDGFNFTQALRTESGLWACVGVLQTEVREARTQEQYDKIMHVYPRYELRIPVG
ncbi:hypothetical protein [Brevibacillus brevis]|uniref:hypothetical protein n=1 Tax=Brevibacillus brevis TaxID=1393 RepID=UPI00165DDEC4|nr:hypothetical protein [Brevibacillus brevis]